MCTNLTIKSQVRQNRDSPEICAVARSPKVGSNIAHYAYNTLIDGTIHSFVASSTLSEPKKSLIPIQENVTHAPPIKPNSGMKSKRITISLKSNG